MTPENKAYQNCIVYGIYRMYLLPARWAHEHPWRSPAVCNGVYFAVCAMYFVCLLLYRHCFYLVGYKSTTVIYTLQPEYPSCDPFIQEELCIQHCARWSPSTVRCYVIWWCNDMHVWVKYVQYVPSNYNRGINLAIQAIIRLFTYSFLAIMFSDVLFLCYDTIVFIGVRS